MGDHVNFDFSHVNFHKDFPFLNLDDYALCKILFHVKGKFLNTVDFLRALRPQGYVLYAGNLYLSFWGFPNVQ